MAAGLFGVRAPRIGGRVPLAFAVIAVVAALVVQSVERELHERAMRAETGHP